MTAGRTNQSESSSGRDRRSLVSPTLLFLLGILAAGFLKALAYRVDGYPDTLIQCLNFALYAGLILYWTQSVHRRLVPSRVRAYMIAAAVLMLGFLLLRSIRYRVPAAGEPLYRFLWYAYYVPLTFAPALFLMTGIRLGSPEGRGWPREKLILIPAAVLSLLFLTNDCHHLAFRPVAGVPLLGETGTYARGWPFYLVIGWVAVSIVAGIFLMVRESGKTRNLRGAAAPLLMLAVMGILLAVEADQERRGMPKPYHFPEICIFTMIGIFEGCIRNRLIPRNENYIGFFREMTLPAVITDRVLRPVFHSAIPVEADRETLRSSLRAPVYLSPDLRLSGKRLRAGYAFWTVDESAIRRINESLIDANEYLEGENALIRAENELKEQKARIESRSRIFSAIGKALYPANREIRELLHDASPGTACFRDRIAAVSVRNAFVKRRANLLLLASETGSVPAAEIALALSEPADYLKYAGVTASVEDSAARTFSAPEAAALVETAEKLTEALMPEISYLMISFSDEALRLTADAERLPAAEMLRTLPLPVTAAISDGLLYLQVSVKGGEAG